jgi:ABC-type amino acid transport substrate-binding protein
MSSLSITPARRYRVAFTNPYLKTGQMGLVRNEDKFKFLSDVAGLADRYIGVKKGTTAEQFVRQEYPRANVKYFSSGPDAAIALAGRKVDMWTCSLEFSR